VKGVMGDVDRTRHILVLVLEHVEAILNICLQGFW